MSERSKWVAKVLANIERGITRLTGDCVMLGHVYLEDARKGQLVACDRCGEEFVFGER